MHVAEIFQRRGQTHTDHSSRAAENNIWRLVTQGDALGIAMASQARHQIASPRWDERCRDTRCPGSIIWRPSGH